MPRSTFSKHLKEIHRLVTSVYSTNDSLMDDYLETGKKIFGMPIGIISNIKKGKYTIQAVSDNYGLIKTGTVFSLANTYCEEVYRKKKVVRYPHIGSLPNMRKEPMHNALILESYISAPVFVDEIIVGTINFSSPEIRSTDYQNEEQEIIELLASDLGNKISLLKKEEDHQENNQLIKILSEAVESSNDGIVITNPNKTDNPLIYVNSAFEKITGYTAGEVLGKNCRFLQGNDCDQPALNVLRNAIAKGISCEVRLKNYKKNGKVFWNNFRLSPIFDNNNTLKYFVGLQADISEQVQQERSFAQLAEQRKILLEIAQKMISLQSEKDITRLIADGTKSLLVYDTLAIYLADHSANKLIPINIDGPKWDAANLDDWSVSIGEGIIGSIVASGKSELISNAHLDARTVYPNGATIQKEQLIVHPLRSGNTVWGAFAINRMSDQVFSIEEFELTNFVATYASLAIENISLIEKLRSTSSRLEKLIQTMQAGVLVEDETRHISLINKNFCSMFAISAEPEKLFGLDCSNSAEQSKHLFFQPQRFIERIESLLRNRTIVTNEELDLIDGRVFERDYIPIFVDTAYKGHLWLYRDITVRKQNEIEMEKIARFTNENPNPIFRIKNDCSILYANDPGIRMLSEVGAIRFDTIPPSWQPIIENTLLNNKTTEFEIVATQGTPIYTAHFVPVSSSGYVNVYARNITERKIAEWETTKAKRIAEESMRAKQDFLAKMSHELRTPMNAVLGLTNLILNTPLSDEQLPLIQGIKSSGNHLLAIINDILNLAKIEAGKMVIDQNDFVLTDMLENIWSAMLPLARQKGIRLLFELDPKLPEVIIGDSVRLGQIIINLLSNALKFTSHGEVVLHCNTEFQSDKPQKIRFRVVDTGIGIPPDKFELIFESFSQASQDISMQYGGTGLGLTIVKQLVCMMNGEIFVESAEGKGSTFTITLPITISEKKKESIVLLSDSTPVFKKLSGRILLVEDNFANQMVAVKTLQLWSVDVEVASDGYEAISKLKESMYDLVLMDIQMPGIDGIETTKRIRTILNEPQRSIPIFAMTASVLYDPELRVINAGMNGYISKPFELDDLYKKISSYLKVDDSFSEDMHFNKVENTISVFKHLNIHFLESIAPNNPQFIIDMVQLFEHNTPEYLRSIKKALQDNDLVALSKIAHTMKPTGAYIGVDALKPIVGSIEECADRGAEETEIIRLVQKLEVLCEEIFTDILQWKRSQR